MARRTGERRATAPTAPAVADTTSTPPRSRTRLLVVDDSVDAQELFRLHLERSGYEVVTAHDGREALEQLGREPLLPGCIIVDLLMPVMDGMELIESLRSDRRLADVPVLVVSAVLQLGLYEALVRRAFAPRRSARSQNDAVASSQPRA